MEQINSLIRTIMTLLGAFLVSGGAKFFGETINPAYWQQITGFVLTVVSIYWSIKTKTVDIEKIQGSVRQAVTFLCGILMGKGILNEQTSVAVIAFAGAIIPYIQAGLARKKNEEIASGNIKFSALKGVTQEHINDNSYIPKEKKTIL